MGRCYVLEPHHSHGDQGAVAKWQRYAVFEALNDTTGT